MIQFYFDPVFSVDDMRLYICFVIFNNFASDAYGLDDAYDRRLKEDPKTSANEELYLAEANQKFDDVLCRRSIDPNKDAATGSFNLERHDGDVRQL